MTTLLFAGHDTQSATLSWALAELALHPEAQARLRGEVLGALGPEPRGAGRSGEGGKEGRGESYVSSKDAGAVVRSAPRLSTCHSPSIRMRSPAHRQSSGAAALR